MPLTEAEEEAAVAFRRHPLLPLDDCLSRLPNIESVSLPASASKRSPVSLFYMDIVEVQTVESNLYRSNDIDRTSNFAVT